MGSGLAFDTVSPVDDSVHTLSFNLALFRVLIIVHLEIRDCPVEFSEF
jgi:hypothetical protein